MEKGGGGSWARGKGLGRGPRRIGPRQLGPKAGRNFLLEGKMQKGNCFPKGEVLLASRELEDLHL